MLEDGQSQLRHCKQRLIPRRVWRAGVSAEVEVPEKWPNPDTIISNRPAWDMLIVRDAIPPIDVPSHIRDAHVLYAAKKTPSGDINPLVFLPKGLAKNHNEVISEALCQECDPILSCLPVSSSCTPPAAACRLGAAPASPGDPVFSAALREKARLFKCC